MSGRDEQIGRDAFLAMVGHELRQPLAPIFTALEIMRQRRSRDSGERARRTIERQVWQLARFVEDLMDYSSAQRGLLALRPEAVELRQILDAAIETAEPVLKHREQSVQVNYPEGGVVLFADPARLTQIFANLLNNTARFAEPGGAISVDVTVRAAEVAVSVRDTSQGISPERLREVFALLVHVEQDKGWPGVGIGLAVVRTLVELHGGTVEAVSPTDDRGAEFVVVLPLQAPAHAATLRGVPQARSEPGPLLS